MSFNILSLADVLDSTPRAAVTEEGQRVKSARGADGRWWWLASDGWTSHWQVIEHVNDAFEKLHGGA